MTPWSSMPLKLLVCTKSFVQGNPIRMSGATFEKTKHDRVRNPSHEEET